MKKGVLMFIIFCITKFSYAQVGIISADFGAVGDSIIFSIDELYVGNIFLGEKGENQTYDYEFLGSSSKDTLLFIAPSSTAGGNIANSNLVLRSNFVDTYWENNPNDLFIKAIGFEFDFSIIDSTDSLRSVYVEYPEGIHQATYYMEYGNGGEYTTDGYYYGFYGDTIPVINIYVDSFRVIDNVTTMDSINGSGTLILPNDTLECLRQEIKSVHSYSIEIKIDLGIFGSLWQALPLPVAIPNTTDKYIRYWAKGQTYPVLEFTLDSLGNATNTQYLYNTVEYIANVKSENKSTFNLYPNPTQNSVTIHLVENSGLSEIVIFDILGGVINSFSTSKNNYLIDLSKYENGIYFIEVKNNNGTMVQKVVKR